MSHSAPIGKTNGSAALTVSDIQLVPQVFSISNIPHECFQSPASPCAMRCQGQLDLNIYTIGALSNFHHLRAAGFDGEWELSNDYSDVTGDHGIKMKSAGTKYQYFFFFYFFVCCIYILELQVLRMHAHVQKSYASSPPKTKARLPPGCCEY